MCMSWPMISRGLEVVFVLVFLMEFFCMVVLSPFLEGQSNMAAFGRFSDLWTVGFTTQPIDRRFPCFADRHSAFPLGGDGGRFHLPLRDSSGFTPDSLLTVHGRIFTLPVKRTESYIC